MPSTMSVSPNRPKRHVPKKMDPDFIAYPFLTSSRQLAVFTSPPRKKPSVSLNESISTTPTCDAIKLPSTPVFSVPSATQPATKSKVTQELKPACSLLKPERCSRSSTPRKRSASSDNTSKGTQPSSDGSDRMKMKRNGHVGTKVKKAVTGYAKNHRVKECEKSACTSTPMCFAGCSPQCTGNGYTSRWHHLSDGEHFCNNCFEHFYRSYKDGYLNYAKWKSTWGMNGQLEPHVKNYMADQKLPYWLQCNKCKKWRQISCRLNITPEFVLRYQCGHNMLGMKKESSGDCEYEEDERVSAVRSDRWLHTLSYPCYLQQSPAAAFMKTYCQDSVGLSPFYHTRQRVTDDDSSLDLESESSGLEHVKKICVGRPKSLTAIKEEPEMNQPSWSNPFMEYVDETETALCFCPSQMTTDEIKAFPEYIKIPQIYLAVRNLVITLWNLDCKNPVTVESCQHHLLCRGLVRIRCVQEIIPVIKFLSLHGYVNTGYISHIPKELHPPKVDQLHVIVVGAGPAGISAAAHLHKFGAQVTILEAKDHLGGRCHDNLSLGVCVGEGAQIIHGTENNPLSVLCHQVSAKLQQIADRCELYQENGQITSPSLDRRIDFHFNAMLDNVAEWRKDKSVNDDASLLEKIKEMHKEFKEESALKFSDEEEKLLQFHCANLEYACGASLDQISALYWDQNENYPQFSGPPHVVTDGFTKVFTKLAEGLDIKYKTQVTKIDYHGDRVTVMTSNDCSYHGDRIVVTVPLATLQQGMIEFNPPLPKKKIEAINTLGCGQVEKVVLQFPHPFWIKKTKGADFFGHVPESECGRGEFGVFYDIKSKSESGPFVLLTHLTGNAVHKMADKTDKDIVMECVKTLQRLFPEEHVPQPVDFFVTHWKDDPYISLAYVHIPVGCCGSVFDDLAEMVDEKIHFAGEATNRQFPQSVTGAYFSGIREAYLILTGLELDLESEAKDTEMKTGHNLQNCALERKRTAKKNSSVGVKSCDEIHDANDAVTEMMTHS